jgi:sec-independent protein translocase protein TatA
MLAEILGADGIIVIVVVVAVLLFGGTKIPKLARGLGSASHEFKKGLEEGDKNEAQTTVKIPQPLPKADGTPDTVVQISQPVPKEPPAN